MKPALPLVAALSILAVTLAGCNTPAPSDFETPPQDEQGRYIITMLPSNKFSPANAEVPVGATVVFINDGGAHNAKAYDGAFDTGSPSSNKGEHGSFTFDKAGEHKYRCVPHESTGMKGVIRVVAA